MSTLEISVGQFSDAGVKPVNEDAIGLHVPEEPLLTNKGMVAVIADGMSGAADGAKASRVCVSNFLSDYYSTPDSWSVKSSAVKILTALNRWLYSQGQSIYGSSHGLVSTLSALVLKSTTAHIFHVGDTRVFLLRDGKLQTITRDHRTHTGGRDFLTRAMGIELSLDVDHQVIAVQPGDTFLMTTDGVHEWVTDASIREILLEQHDDLIGASRSLVQMARRNGSNDNLTAQVFTVHTLAKQDQESYYNELTALPFPPLLEPGYVLDGYRVMREIHANKRTQVYLVTDEASGNQLIMKTPSPNYSDEPLYIDLFLHEEWIGRRLESPHVMKVIEPERPRQWLYYLAEYIEGQTLRQWMNDNPEPTLQRFREIIDETAAGLRAFQRMEMIHQDLKPENIMITGDGTVKIIDFGSAKVAGLAEIEVPIDRDVLLGTERYTAPEYLRGLSGTNRSDIFSLGVIAYEMLTGTLPYSMVLSTRNLNRVKYQSAMPFNQELPRWMDSAMAKSVALDPNFRYESLSEFIRDLTHPNKGFNVTQPLMQRNPVAFWRGTTILLGVLLLISLINR
ncbi:MAG: protein kinase [Immundisolibacteraceae bacterium]|nr:protein kinase [Immundisolibacteraceae bacterium]